MTPVPFQGGGLGPPSTRRTGCRWHWEGRTQMPPRNGVGSWSCHNRTIGMTTRPEPVKRAIDPSGRNQQTCQLPQVSPLLCDSPTGARPGPPHHPGTAWPQRREDQDDLYPCAESWPMWGDQRGGPSVASRTAGSRTRPCLRHPRATPEKSLALEGDQGHEHGLAGFLCRRSAPCRMDT